LIREQQKKYYNFGDTINHSTTLNVDYIYAQ